MWRDDIKEGYSAVAELLQGADLSALALNGVFPEGLPREYAKRLNTFASEYRKPETQAESKRLRWEKSRQLQLQKGVSVARILQRVGAEQRQRERLYEARRRQQGVAAERDAHHEIPHGLVAPCASFASVLAPATGVCRRENETAPVDDGGRVPGKKEGVFPGGLSEGDGRLRATVERRAVRLAGARDRDPRLARCRPRVRARRCGRGGCERGPGYIAAMCFTTCRDSVIVRPHATPCIWSG